MAFVLLCFVSGSLQQNYVFSDASSVASIPTSIAIDNTASPADASLTLCTELAAATSFLWYKIDAASSLRTITVDTCDVSFDSVVGVFSGADFASLMYILFLVRRPYYLFFTIFTIRNRSSRFPRNVLRSNVATRSTLSPAVSAPYAG